MDSSFLKTLSSIKERFNIEFDLKQEQIYIIKAILNGNDVFGVLPTGFGKSICYVIPPLVLNETTGKKNTALVISPLKALMLQQVQKLGEMGIKSYAICEGGLCEQSLFEIHQADVLFASPESLLKPKWLRVVKQLKKQLCVQVYDEVHCISEWGLDFRPDYRNVRQLCSIVEAPTLALTATATTEIQKDVFEVLCLDPTTTTVVSKIPNRPNIFVHVIKAKEDFQQELQWLVELVTSKGIETPKTILYCSSIHRCQMDYNIMLTEMGSKCYHNADIAIHNRLVEMFHSATADPTKRRILEQFSSLTSTIRVLFATIAFGIGVDIPDVQIIINWGIPRSVLQFWQESGRCARDGRPGLSICYAYPRSMRNCTDKDLCDYPPRISVYAERSCHVSFSRIWTLPNLTT